MKADQSTTLDQIKERVKAFADEREWQQFHTPKNLSMAIAAEAAELMEHFLWSDGAGSLAIMNDAQKSAEIRDELADIIIYALEFANIANIDVALAIEAKMEQNARKYPVEKARGKSLKYTEL